MQKLRFGKINIISLRSAHVRSGQIQKQSPRKWQVSFPIHVPIRVQNITFNLNKLFLDHKPIGRTGFSLCVRRVKQSFGEESSYLVSIATFAVKVGLDQGSALSFTVCNSEG